MKSQTTEKNGLLNYILSIPVSIFEFFIFLVNMIIGDMKTIRFWIFALISIWFISWFIKGYYDPNTLLLLNFSDFFGDLISFIDLVKLRLMQISAVVLFVIISIPVIIGVGISNIFSK